MFSTNAALFALELINPFFGWWHGFSLLMGVGVSVVYGGGLQYYSTRMANNIFIKRGGKEMRIEFLNAFWMPKTMNLKIIDNGYFEPSRLYNVQYSLNKKDHKIYINMPRNQYKHPEYNNLIRKILSGQELSLMKPGEKKR